MNPCPNRGGSYNKTRICQPPQRVVCSRGQNIDTFGSDEDDYDGYYDTKVHAVCNRKGQINSRFPTGTDKSDSKQYEYQWTKTVPCPNTRAGDQYKLSATGEDGLYYGNTSDYSMEDDIDPVLRYNEDVYGLGSQSSLETMTRVSDHQKRQTRVCSNVGEMINDREAYRVSEVKIPIARSDSKTGKNKIDRPCKRAKPKSILKRFDEAVSLRLQKLIVDTNEVYSSSAEPCAPLRGGRRSVTTRTSLSTIELARSLHPDYKSGALIDATDKLAQAEAACRYDGAIRAAEAAAASFAEGLEAEEAAVAGVRGYQAELTDTIKHSLSGSKPIEVLGYIGITKPR